MGNYHKEAHEERAHKHVGRKFGKHDYYHADEAKHLSKDERKDSHFKHDFLLQD